MKKIILILIIFGSIETSAQALATSEDTFLICKSKKLIGTRANDDETNGFIQIERIVDEDNPDINVMIDWVESKKTDSLAGKDIYTVRVSELPGSMNREVYRASNPNRWLTLNRISLDLEIYGNMDNLIHNEVIHNYNFYFFYKFSHTHESHPLKTYQLKLKRSYYFLPSNYAFQGLLNLQKLF